MWVVSLKDEWAFLETQSQVDSLSCLELRRTSPEPLNFEHSFIPETEDPGQRHDSLNVI